MWQTLLLAFLLASSIEAMTLTEIIDLSLSKSPSLDVINARIEANKQNIKLSQQFANPELFLSRNTLDSKQAMHKTTLTFKQKLPYFDKRDTNKQVAIAGDNILDEKLKQAKVNLVEEIKNEAYTIWELKELYKIVENYVQLTKRNIELYEAYTSIDDNKHMGILKAELSLSDLQIQKSRLNAKIYSAYARLSYLAAFEVKELEIDLYITKKPNLTSLKSCLISNPDVIIKEKELLKENAKIKVAEMDKYPDFNLLAGVVYRENFDNYFNIGLGISLPLYGSEDIKKEQQVAYALSVASQKSDVEISINAKLREYYAQMLSFYEVYHIVQDNSLPQIEHMFQISNSSISIGGDLFKYIDVLFLKLNLEKQSINAIANYNRVDAKIAALQGALK
ncbi:MAG: TolC family protein [Sulfurimonas sp.]